MRWLAASLTLVLTFSLAAAAQVRGGSVQIGTAAGSVSATLPPGIHIGNTQFPPFRNDNFRFHNHRHFRGNAFAYPYAYGAYGDYAPYAWDYPGDYYSGDYPGYTGYIPGTFDAYSYAPYAGSPYPAQYAPPAYYVPRSAPPPAPSAPQPDSYQRQPSNSHQSSEEAEPTVLVFRDGHREEIANYAIMGSTLFVLSGPRARIPVAELDIPATERVNQNRGIDFKVPKGQ